MTFQGEIFQRLYFNHASREAKTSAARCFVLFPELQTYGVVPEDLKPYQLRAVHRQHAEYFCDALEMMNNDPIESSAHITDRAVIELAYLATAGVN